MKILVWKTGRLYDKYGQLMLAAKVGSNIVYFDASRGLDGVIAAGNTGIDTDTECGFKDLVMVAYDRGLYSNAEVGSREEAAISELYAAAREAKAADDTLIEEGYKA